MVLHHIGITRQYLWALLPFSGFAFGRFLDNQETERMTLFRDRSALYGGRVKPNDPPSWP